MAVPYKKQQQTNKQTFLHAPSQACRTVKIFLSIHCSTHMEGAYGKRANGGGKDTACMLNTLTAH